MPTQASARPALDGALPAGISIVSFGGGLTDRSALAPIDIPTAPYGTNSAVQVLTGVAGELIEVVHRI